MRLFLPLQLLPLLLTACQAPALEPDCHDAGIPTVSVLDPGTDGALASGTITIEGAASHPQGYAIRSITVANARSTPDANAWNFSSWSVDLSWSTLVELAEGEEGDEEVEVAVVATDTCGNTASPEDGLWILVDLDGDAIEVNGLEVDVGYPAQGADYVPTSPAQAAVLTITADKEGAGAELKLSAASGSFGSTSSSTATLTLSGDGDEEAAAFALFTPAEAGSTLIELSAGDEVITTTVVAAAPPAFSSTTGTLPEGATLTVTVETEGSIHTCTGQAVDGLSAVVGGTSVDLASSGSAQVLDIEGGVSIEISASGLTEDGQLSLSCADDYNQQGSATFTLVAAP